MLGKNDEFPKAKNPQPLRSAQPHFEYAQSRQVAQPSFIAISPRHCGQRSASTPGSDAASGGATGCGLSIGRLRSEEHTSELQSLMRISYAVFCLTKKTIHMSNPST